MGWELVRSRGLGLALLLAWATSAGCTTMREVPRGEYAAQPQRKALRVETRDGLVYVFDYATFDPDTLTGYRQRSDVEGPADQVAVVKVALDDIQRLTTRSVDWYRTGLVGGGVLAGVLAVGLNQANHNPPASDGSGGGKGCCPN